jgi:hypothetical protein
MSTPELHVAATLSHCMKPLTNRGVASQLIAIPSQATRTDRRCSCPRHPLQQPLHLCKNVVTTGLRLNKPQLPYC